MRNRPCQWFSLCPRLAAGEVMHPTLGLVPTCQECAERLDLVFEIEFDDDPGSSSIESPLI